MINEMAVQLISFNSCHQLEMIVLDGLLCPKPRTDSPTRKKLTTALLLLSASLCCASCYWLTYHRQDELRSKRGLIPASSLRDAAAGHSSIFPLNEAKYSIGTEGFEFEKVAMPALSIHARHSRGDRSGSGIGSARLTREQLK